MDANILNKGVQKIIENKSVFLVVVVILFFVICAVILFGDYSSKVEAYKKENQTKLEKIDLIVQVNGAADSLDVFLKTLSDPLGGDELSNKIEEFALKNHINIVDMTAKDPQKMEMYSVINFHVSMIVKDFKHLVAFLNMLETSKYSFKIESVTSSASAENDGSFKCDVNIVSTQIKR